jgi:hypothetical protein
MRLLTWNLGHRLNGGHAPDEVITALATLEPDILILTGRVAEPARKSLLASISGLGLTHQLVPASTSHGDHVLVASRLELLPGLLGEPEIGDDLPRNMLHAYAPSGVLDVLSLGSPDPGDRPTARRACWQWLFRAAATLKHRRAVLIGDFDVEANGEPADGIDHLRQLIDAGWKHAAPSEGAAYTTANGGGRLDHAFLSPSVQQIDARYALAAAGFRLSGAKGSPSAQPVLVVDLQ